MPFCKVTIRMPDGSKSLHEGQYAHSFDAAERAFELFPDATGISVIAETVFVTKPLSHLYLIQPTTQHTGAPA